MGFEKFIGTWIMFRKLALLLMLSLMMSNCSGPQMVVDPDSIIDEEKYKNDLKECELLSEQYDLSKATVTSGAVGAGIGHVAATTLLGTVGAIIFPGGVAIATAGGAGVGLGISKSKENKAREVILADYIKDRGYKAYSGS